MTGEPSTTTAFDLAAVAKVIEQLNERYTGAHVDGDVAAIDAMFTRDATCFPPGAEALIGRAAIHDLTVACVEGGIATAFFDEAHTTVHRADSQAMRWVTDLILANGVATLGAARDGRATLQRVPVPSVSPPTP